MLQHSGPVKIENLIFALKSYLPLYGKKEKEVCEVPFKNLDTGKVMLAKFQWLAEQWVYVDYRDK